VEEHGGQKRPENGKGEGIHGGESVLMEVVGGHDTEEIEEGLDLGRGQAELKGEDQTIDQDDEPGHEWRVAMGDVIAEREQDFSPCDSSSGQRTLNWRESRSGGML
jgi:hypothetical protein